MVLPHVETMTPELVSKIESLVRAGATIIGNPPVRSPSLVNYPECDKQVKALAENIWGSGETPKELTLHEYGHGKIWQGEVLKTYKSISSIREDTLNLYPDYNLTTSLLKSAGVKPDFISSGNIRYTHRSLTDRDIYFISNRTGSIISDTCIFRNGTANAELWNPVTGEINSLRCFHRSDGTISVPVSLDAYESYFIVFYHLPPSASRKLLNPENFQEKQTIYTLAGAWNLSFDTVWGGPDHIVFDSLIDWSQRPEDGVRYYSGIALYNKSFDLPDNQELSENYHYYLDCGILKNLGRIKLNGRDLGIIWTSPWQVDITDVLKRKYNTLEIQVANLWINRLIGDESRPWDGVINGRWPEWLLNGTRRESKRYTFTTHHFYRKGDPLAESGLIGPVSIRMVKKPPHF